MTRFDLSDEARHRHRVKRRMGGHRTSRFHRRGLYGSDWDQPWLSRGKRGTVPPSLRQSTILCFSPFSDRLNPVGPSSTHVDYHTRESRRKPPYEIASRGLAACWPAVVKCRRCAWDVSQPFVPRALFLLDPARELPDHAAGSSFQEVPQEYDLPVKSSHDPFFLWLKHFVIHHDGDDRAIRAVWVNGEEVLRGAT